MSLEEDLVRLVKATVKEEVENHLRMRASELSGRGGDTVVASMGDIHLQPGVGRRAYYKGIEIGSGSLTSDDLAAYLPLTGGTMTGDITFSQATANVNFQRAGSTVGQITAFEGASIYDFAVIANQGRLYLSSVDSIQCEDPLIMGGNDVLDTGDVYPSSSDSYDLGLSSRWYRNVYAQKHYVDDANTYISNNAGVLELHAASSVKIVVG